MWVGIVWLVSMVGCCWWRAAGLEELDGGGCDCMLVLGVGMDGMRD